MHMTIHVTRAVGPEFDFGDFRDTELRVLTMHRKRVSSRPSLPGIAFDGTMKLT